MEEIKRLEIALKVNEFMWEFATAYDEAAKKPENIHQEWGFGWEGLGELRWAPLWNLGHVRCIYCDGPHRIAPSGSDGRYRDHKGPHWERVFFFTQHVFERFGLVNPSSTSELQLPVPWENPSYEGCWSLKNLNENVKQQMEAQEKSQP